MLRQLKRRLHVEIIPESLEAKIQTLCISQLEELGEALLEFSELADLETWLATQHP
ncbi:MAG: DUF4351 domain-containing protein [Leptolyngbyaceae cyanobacterium SL_1_1]|nr:DUF4351 domain-containing protein [Leptolyngbyaceae cyanobacterium SL_1_1]